MLTLPVATLPIRMVQLYPTYGILGDGNSANTANPSHTYTTAGTYNAELTVTDNDGETDFDNITPTTVKIQIFSAQGKKITTLVSSRYPAGFHKGLWNGKDQNGNQVAGGIYIYRIVTDKFVTQKKMSLIR